MSLNPYPNPPIGKSQAPIQGAATHATAKAVWASDNKATSSIIILTDNTTFLEVGAIGAGAAIKFLTQSTVDSSVAGTSVISAAGTANADHFFAPDTINKIAIPVAYQVQTSIVGANVQNGLYKHIAIKSLGASSVMVNEF